MSDFNEATDLQISRFLAVPRAKIWKAWSDPAHLAQWWCPKPWTTEVRAFDFRAGGAFHTYMTGPDGKGGAGESDNPGAFLEIVPMERIAFTTMLAGGWRPMLSWMPMTAIFSMSDEPGGTRYIARCLHPDPATSKKHADMGFYEGWGTCAKQLEDYATALG
ncbi:MAG: SRPBCC family protein [Hyphomonadaceae bacterium]|nr:SRPBCC family protein [Hyphomonadaceae bacterium]